MEKTITKEMDRRYDRRRSEEQNGIMKPYIKMTLAIYATALVYGVLIGVFAFVLSDIRHATESMEECEAVSGQPVQKERLSSWDLLTVALMMTESRCDSSAISADSLDRGILQLREVYIDDVNRIIGYDRYTYQDAFSVSTALEMYNIYQNHYNPKQDADRAILLHNPTAGPWYREKVKRNLAEIIRYEKIREQLL